MSTNRGKVHGGGCRLRSSGLDQPAGLAGAGFRMK